MLVVFLVFVPFSVSKLLNGSKLWGSGGKSAAPSFAFISLLNLEAFL